MENVELVKGLIHKCLEQIELTEEEQAILEILFLTYEEWLKRELDRTQYFIKRCVHMTAEQKKKICEYALRDDMQPHIAELLRSVVGEKEVA